jgi:hypothetical protein
MKKYLCILALLFFTGIAALAQTNIVNTSRSNIKHGVMASYTAADGLVLSFNQNLMDAASKQAFAAGKFIVKEVIILTSAECQALNIQSGIITPGSGSITKVNGKATIKPGYTLKIGGAEHKNDWPQK